MKTNFLFLLATTILSISCICCSQTSLKGELVGVWEMCSKESGNKVVKYNLCPKIGFNENLKGNVHQSSEVFGWNVSGDTLFVRKLVGDAHVFKDSVYLMSFSRKKDYLELRLKNITSEDVMVLGK